MPLRPAFGLRAIPLQFAFSRQRRCRHGQQKSAMPALTVARVRWHIASDDVPLFATFGGAFHALWIVVIVLTSQRILHMPTQCHHEGRQYIATVTGLLSCFTLGFVVEVLLTWEGCKGEHLNFRAEICQNTCCMYRILTRTSLQA